MKQIPKSKTSSVLLLIPSEWIAQLDTLAKSRNLSRLALIRLFLRIQMDSELAQLAAHFKQQDEQRRTQKRLDSYLSERDY